LTDPVSVLRGVGPRLAEKLERLHIRTARDLLFHLPSRYQDRTKKVAIGSLVLNTQVVIEGEVEAAQVAYGRRRSLLVRLADGTGAVYLRFFYFNRAQQNRFAKGRSFRCFGEVRRGPTSFEFVHPECQIIDPERPTELDDRLTPVYPTTEGLHQTRLRRLIDQSLAYLDADDSGPLPELVPLDILSRYKLPPLAKALRYCHRPPPEAPIERLLDGSHPAQRRLAFEELLAHQLSLKRLRHKARAHAAPRLRTRDGLRARLAGRLGFELTGAQHRVIAEIDADLDNPAPMLRLLQGDVGSGKTAVAAMVACAALDNEYQVALMAPTEILAEQHWQNFSRWFEPLGVEVVTLTGRLPQAKRADALRRLADRRPLVAVGTHALFQEGVEYADLGLIIVDEQHRFGVHQRLALWGKGSRGRRRPHQLIMTATPIPRTLAMTAYADLDVSVLDELPPGRVPARTHVLPETRRAEVVERIAAACRENRQAYWVCPLIDESEAIEVQAATDAASELEAALPGLSIGLIHGRLNDKRKQTVMTAFANHAVDLLVATTVIEVGVDVPNASLMVIENAERLGLSQLHQLRGRIGRGGNQSDCLLLYKAPLGEIARHRLQVIRDTNDGFVIAERDLELRGAGEVLGTRQTGLSELRIADLARDRDMLGAVQASAEELLATDPAAAEQIIGRWLAGRIEYGNV
jgi:ATP-dependent DNA helicase RecG